MLRSYCEINNLKEISELNSDMDFRKPEYRKQVFIDLFEFHTSFGIQPGLVYLYLPEISKRLSLDLEQRLWLAFLEGCTENPCTAYQILVEFPKLPRTDRQLNSFLYWHDENWRTLQYDIDTRYNKGHLVEQVVSYVDSLRGDSQEAWFMESASRDKKEWFDKVWNKAVKLYKFGRLTTWSYLEFVKIVSGFEFEFSSLKMTDIDGSKSHRNGLLKVLGRDDLECWKMLDNGIDRHDKTLCQELEIKGAELLSELRERFKNKKWKNYIGNETLESTLCTFKNCFRGRRYPNVYTDMSYDRIKKAEAVVPDVDFSIFWDIRREKLPIKLLEECNADRGGVLSEKQRLFQETGKFPIMGILKDYYKD